jgi:hypothetical protein
MQINKNFLRYILCILSILHKPKCRVEYTVLIGLKHAAKLEVLRSVGYVRIVVLQDDGRSFVVLDERAKINLRWKIKNNGFNYLRCSYLSLILFLDN